MRSSRDGKCVDAIRICAKRTLGARQAATERNDRQGYADVLHEWGRACVEQGDYKEAAEYLEQSLAVAQALGYQAGIANALHDLARIDLEQSNFSQARMRLESSRQIREALGDSLGAAATLYDLANVEYFSREFDLAAAYGKQALEIQKAADDKKSMIKTLGALALFSLRSQDSIELAQEYGALAIKYCDELGEKAELASTLRSMAEISRRQGDLSQAQGYADKGLSLFKLLGDRKSQARVLYTTSQIFQDKYRSGSDQQDWESARKTATASLKLCIELDDKLGMMYLYTHLGDLHVTTNAPEAGTFWSKAQEIALTLNSSFADEIRARLES